MSLNRTLREKYIWTLCGVLILTFAFVEYVGKPLYLKQKTQEQMIANKIFLITKYYENLNQKAYYQERERANQRLSVELAKLFLSPQQPTLTEPGLLAKLFPSPQQPALAAADLQKSLEDKARKTRVHLVQVKTEKAKYMEDLLTVPVKITVKSTLEGLSQFVRLIENDEKFLVVEELVIRRINKKDPEQLESRLLVNGFIQQRKSEVPDKT
ncbi:MAG: hypothetical protein E2O45_04395 [Nitrospina sp.]|nr:MAG: hypothetical protein E2O45_04395 [Nitrospina sp.]